MEVNCPECGRSVQIPNPAGYSATEDAATDNATLAGHRKRHLDKTTASPTSGQKEILAFFGIAIDEKMNRAVAEALIADLRRSDKYRLWLVERDRRKHGNEFDEAIRKLRARGIVFTGDIRFAEAQALLEFGPPSGEQLNMAKRFSVQIPPNVDAAKLEGLIANAEQWFEPPTKTQLQKAAALGIEVPEGMRKEVLAEKIMWMEYEIDDQYEHLKFYGYKGASEQRVRDVVVYLNKTHPGWLDQPGESVRLFLDAYETSAPRTRKSRSPSGCLVMLISGVSVIILVVIAAIWLGGRTGR